MAARLGVDARISLAQLLGLELVPAALSVWGDLADDAALVAEFDVRDGTAADSAGYVREFRRWLRTQASAAQPMGLAPAIARTRLTTHGAWVRAVLVVSPARLRDVSHRLTDASAAVPPAPRNP